MFIHDYFLRVNSRNPTNTIVNSKCGYLINEYLEHGSDLSHVLPSHPEAKGTSARVQIFYQTFRSLLFTIVINSQIPRQPVFNRLHSKH